jgi:hypothetical protein
MSSSCAEARTLLPAAPLEALDRDEQAFLTEHLASCETCRERSRVFAGAFAAVPRFAAGPAPAADPLWDRICQAIDVPAETAGPAAPVVTIALVCCFCRDGVARAEAAYCASCLAPHHTECFKAHGRCSAFGCEETRTVRPHAEPASPRRVLRVAAGVLLVAGIAGAAALTTNVVAERRHAAELQELEARHKAELSELIPKIEAELKATEFAHIEVRGLPGPELEKRIEELYARIKRLIDTQDIEQLAQPFQELDQLMTEYEKPGVEKSPGKLERWMKSLDEWKEVRLAIQLQIYLNQGNQGLKALVTASKAIRYAEGLEAYTELQKVVARMRGEEREEFHRNADAIAVRAEKVMNELLLSTIKLQLDLTGDYGETLTGRWPRKDLEIPDGSEWRTSRSGDEIVLAIEAGTKTPARLTMPVPAAKLLLAALEKRIGEETASGDATHVPSMDTRIYTGVYTQANGELTLENLSGDMGKGWDEKGTESRILFTLTDTPRSFSPLMVRMNVSAARELARQLRWVVDTVIITPVKPK